TPEVVGSGPVDRHVVLLDSSGQAIRLQGNVVAELARLSGAQVDAWGHSDGGSFSVSRYDLVSVEGDPALVGRVERAASGAVILRTEDGRQLELTGAAASLSPGAKVWVQGPEAL